MTQVALLWHMHQPYYEDLVTREHILPWVRLHALKDYFGMVALVREFPAVRMTFNLVPSLLVQLEAFAEGRAADRFLDVGLRPADSLTPADAVFMAEHFFHAQKERMIDVSPRYRELAAKRGRGPDFAAAARRLTVDDLRDLQVWQKLAWFDPSYLEGDGRVRMLVARDRGFTEDDKLLLRDVELELLNKVIPAYREAAEAGAVELSTSPFYHPILPLLCDTDIYRRTHPDSAMPRRRFVHPEDAAEQITRALACHERLFGRRPRGLWPSEGSVSDAIVPLTARAGLWWMATDEMILARTQQAPFTRDSNGHIEQPERLYKPYLIRVGDSRIACLFRDHRLSDLIGFTYSGWNAVAAADDFVARLVEAGRRFRAKTGGGEAVIPIILDGENAWEHFEGGGRPFLRALYQRLSAHSELRTVTMSEACQGVTAELAGVFPGSWIDANFYIWVGHRDDHLAWGQLGDARDALDSPGSHVTPPDLARAWQELFIAEGSDWFWWYGDDHSSEHDLEFDDLFRRHLRNVYRLLQKPVPDELYVTNISVAAPAAVDIVPTALISPTIDGEETSYFEWLGSGALEVRHTAGAMHQIERPSGVERLLFGFDRSHLYLRVDGTAAVESLLAGGLDITIRVMQPEGTRLPERLLGSEATAGGVRWAAGQVLEVSVPFEWLGLAAGRPLAFFVLVLDALGNEVERYPAHRPIDVDVPDASFEGRHWTA
jgi:alpha-amylase/alpha-mannosidase (GH57 family)